MTTRHSLSRVRSPMLPDVACALQKSSDLSAILRCRRPLTFVGAAALKCVGSARADTKVHGVVHQALEISQVTLCCSVYQVAPFSDSGQFLMSSDPLLLFHCRLMPGASLWRRRHQSSRTDYVSIISHTDRSTYSFTWMQPFLVFLGPPDIPRFSHDSPSQLDFDA